MMISKIKIIPLLQIVLLLLLLIGCGGSSGPNNSEVEMAIKKSLEGGELPSQLQGGFSPYSPRSISVEKINIIDIGSILDEGTKQYWPVKVDVSGKYTISELSVSPGRKERVKSFNGITVYNLSEDGFGGWKATHDKDFKQ